jgi:hypothetical protein
LARASRYFQLDVPTLAVPYFLATELLATRAWAQTVPHDSLESLNYRLQAFDSAVLGTSIAQLRY